MTKIGITGSTGRMGQMLIQEIYHSTHAELSAALTRPGNPMVGQDVGNLVGLPPFGIEVTDQVSHAVDVSHVIIDFTRPDATMEIVRHLQKAPVPLVIGTSGFGEDEKAELSKAAFEIPILLTSNTSLGVAVLRKVSKEVAKALGPDYDVEIMEMHHRGKVDAPSGTALHIGEDIASVPGFHINTRTNKNGQRERGAVEFLVSRGGSVVADQHVMFAGEKEMITLSHRALDRSLFAQGALKAALWIKEQPPGLYSMDDMISL